MSQFRPFAGGALLVSALASTLVAVGLAAPAGAADAPAVMGTPPQSDQRDLSDVPGERAMIARFWFPSLDENFVPQGVTVVGRHALIAAYRSERTDPAADTCRIFRLSIETGSLAGSFSLPKSCGHAGGLAHDRQGTLFVADTSTLYVIDLARAIDDGHTERALRKELSFGGVLRGSFAAYRDGDIWIGVHHRREPRRLYRIPVARIMAKTAGALLTEADAADSIPISTRSQGAAFDASGGLWISQSGRSAATLQKVDPRSGTVKQSCEMPPGLEDLSFDSQGRLWAVSEAGAGRHRDWPTYYPLVFAFDPAKLKPC